MKIEDIKKEIYDYYGHTEVADGIIEYHKKRRSKSETGVKKDE